MGLRTLKLFGVSPGLEFETWMKRGVQPSTDQCCLETCLTARLSASASKDTLSLTSLLEALLQKARHAVASGKVRHGPIAAVPEFQLCTGSDQGCGSIVLS